MRYLIKWYFSRVYLNIFNSNARLFGNPVTPPRSPLGVLHIKGRLGLMVQEGGGVGVAGFCSFMSVSHPSQMARSWLSKPRPSSGFFFRIFQPTPDQKMWSSWGVRLTRGPLKVQVTLHPWMDSLQCRSGDTSRLWASHPHAYSTQRSLHSPFEAPSSPLRWWEGRILRRFSFYPDLVYTGHMVGFILSLLWGRPNVFFSLDPRTFFVDWFHMDQK